MNEEEISEAFALEQSRVNGFNPRAPTPVPPTILRGTSGTSGFGVAGSPWEIEEVISW